MTKTFTHNSGGRPDRVRRRLLAGLGATVAGSILPPIVPGSHHASAAPTATAFRSFDGRVTTGADGSVGQTYVGPDWDAPQWYRETLALPKARTPIPGAGGRVYLATADDIGFRLVMEGLDRGIVRTAAAWNPVPVTILPLEDFATVSGWAVVGSAVLSLDRGKLVVTETGKAGRAQKSIGLHTPADWDVVTILQDRGTDPDRNQSGGPTNLFSIDGAPPVAIGGGISSGRSGTGFLGIHSSARHVRETPTLAAATEPVAIDLSTAASFKGSNFRTVRRHLCTLARSQGRAKVLLTCDDGFATQFTNTAKQAEAVGMLLSFFVPWKVVDGTIPTRGRMDVAMLQDLHARGHAVCLDGTADDAAMNASSRSFVRNTPADNLAELEAGRAWLVENNLVDGLGGDGRDAICYPNGVFEDRVAGAYDKGRLPAALKAAGFKFARTTLAGTYATRFGFDDGWLLFPGCSTSRLTAEQMRTNVELAILRGAVACLYFHRTVDEAFVPFLRWLANQRDTGRLDVVTVPQLIAADHGSSCPA